MNALIKGQGTIKVFVGEPVADPILHEFWVLSSSLVDLLLANRAAVYNDDSTITESIATVIAKLLQYSSAGRYEFVHRAVNKKHNSDKEVQKKC